MLRVKLVIKDIDLKNYVTGVTCAVLGHKEKDGSFAVNMLVLNTLIILYKKYNLYFIHYVLFRSKNGAFLVARLKVRRCNQSPKAS